MPAPDPSKLRLAFDLFESGLKLMRQTLRRRFPADTDEDIEARLDLWLSERGGAEYGDAEGLGKLWTQSSG